MITIDTYTKPMFVESICFKDGVYQNLPLHQARVNQTFEELSLGKPHQLHHILPHIELEGTYKVRVVYDQTEVNVNYVLYERRGIQSLEVVESQPFDYHLKYENRKIINDLKKQSKADEIIISVNNEITDASYANLVFWDGSNWLTPSSYLLNGVKRQALLSNGSIKEALITRSDLPDFEKVCLINAMLDLDEIVLPMK